MTVDGGTFFMRCGDCETMYRPREAWSFSGGDIGPSWFRPKSIRKPKACDHPPESVQMWADGAWRSTPYSPAE